MSKNNEDTQVKSSHISYPISKQEKNKYIPIINPMTLKEKRKYIPLVSRIIGEEEQRIIALRQKKKASEYEKKVKEYFVQEKDIQTVKLINTKIKVDNSSDEFFNSLSDDSSAIDIE